MILRSVFNTFCTNYRQIRRLFNTSRCLSVKCWLINRWQISCRLLPLIAIRIEKTGLRSSPKGSSQKVINKINMLIFNVGSLLYPRCQQHIDSLSTIYRPFSGLFNNARSASICFRCKGLGGSGTFPKRAKQPFRCSGLLRPVAIEKLSTSKRLLIFSGY